MNSKISEALAVVLLIGFVLLASWLICGAITKAICVCFEWDFTLKRATGIWLCIWFFKLVFARGGE